jgi:NAD(P)-dependent dehydrogenase (short-subunit alcohol dehydrogenase family)
MVTFALSWQLLQDESLAKILGDEEHLSVEVVDSFVSQYLEDVKTGMSEKKWSRVEPAYSESKIFLGALTRALAKTLSGKQIFVNVVHPGYIQTDMTVNLQYGVKSSVAEGADTPVWLALLPKENYPNRKFFYKREPFAW